MIKVMIMFDDSYRGQSFRTLSTQITCSYRQQQLKCHATSSTAAGRSSFIETMRSSNGRSALYTPTLDQDENL